MGIESDFSVKLKPRPSWTIFVLFSGGIFWWHLVHSEYPLWVSWHLPFTQASDWNVLPHLWYIIFVTMCQMMLQVRDCYRATNKGGRGGGYSKCSLDHDHLLWGREKSINDHSITLLNLVWKRKYSQFVFMATLGSILDSQLSWESGKFQLARWSHEVVLFPERTSHPPATHHMDFSCWIYCTLSLECLGTLCSVSEGCLES